jgi:hypothetical protein
MKLKHILTRDAVTHLSERTLLAEKCVEFEARPVGVVVRTKPGQSRVLIPWSNIVYGTLVDEDEG